jgi:hypothetical protein
VGSDQDREVAVRAAGKAPYIPRDWHAHVELAESVDVGDLDADTEAALRAASEAALAGTPIPVRRTLPWGEPYAHRRPITVPEWHRVLTEVCHWYCAEVGEVMTREWAKPKGAPRAGPQPLPPYLIARRIFAAALQAAGGYSYEVVPVWSGDGAKRVDAARGRAYLKDATADDVSRFAGWVERLREAGR